LECFKAVNPGFFSTIQDMGRFGYESQGVPTSGVMDEFAFRAANILLGNEEDAPVLEITITGPALEVLEDTAVAVTGADMAPSVNGFIRPCWSSFPVKKGDIISFSPIRSGARAYLAVSGGFDGDLVMGSYSTYTRGHIGGIKGRRLEKGDILLRREAASPAVYHKVKEKYIPSYPNEADILIVPGPQDDYFTREAAEILMSSTYTIGNDSDRMGYRLEGPEIRAAEKHDIITDGLLPGAVQIPGNGKPIIMLKDAQTTGGYTKIATVISPDLQKLAQLKPGDKLKFKTVNIATAHRLLAEQEETLEKIKKSMDELRFFSVGVNGTFHDVYVEE